MEVITTVLIISQLLFTIIAGTYFFTMLKNQRSVSSPVGTDSKEQLKKIRELREIRLSKPLSEKTRPQSLDMIIGQEEGIKALRAALCSENPQHVLIYGPPGIGKTAAARLMLEEAKKTKNTPFKKNASFIEMDATVIRFDERSIADPLMGSVHDPIYQGAGAYGSAGVPQPKEGAVTKAHGGILFIDEIGELHPMQMNKLLKVLEDRKVILNSAYYSLDNKNIPQYIHDIFQNGLPADFRLVGATTRSPDEIPPALRSRCTEIYFCDLKKSHIKKIVQNAAETTEMKCNEETAEKVTVFAANGRDAVNIMQTAASVAHMEKRQEVTVKDIEWVAKSGRFSPRLEIKIEEEARVGTANGLAVCGSGGGTVLQIEAWAVPVEKGLGSFKITGIVEEEEIKSGSQIMKRKSTASSSVLNVLTVLNKELGIDTRDYDIHINFPGGTPVDGPSAGIAIFSALYSAVTGNKPVDKIAMTGEISINGNVLPVGGVARKIEAAADGGAVKVIIPGDNYQSSFKDFEIEIIPVKNIRQLLSLCFDEEKSTKTA